MLGRTINIRFGGPLTYSVKLLIIINAAVFIIQKILNIFIPGVIENVFGLSYTGFFQELKLWQPVTYMFLHGGFFHIIFNLLTLFMFGGELEQKWGSKGFLQYYLFCGLGAGVFITLMNYLTFNTYGYTSNTIGASGAIYGLLLAYGMIWPNREVLLYFLFPIKIKYLVIAFGLIEFFGTISSAMGTGGAISHIGHVGGLITGFLYIILKNRKAKSGRSFGGDTINDFLKKERIKRKQEEIDRRIKAKEIIDTLLEKIAREGMESLSSKEKNELEWARKHYYPNDEDILH
jgi:membrane associated rhomboid family serine protease